MVFAFPGCWFHDSEAYDRLLSENAFLQLHFSTLLGLVSRVFPRLEFGLWHLQYNSPHYAQNSKLFTLHYCLYSSAWLFCCIVKEAGVREDARHFASTLLAASLLHSDLQLYRRIQMKSALTRRTLPVVPCQGQNAVVLLAATQHAKLCAGERKGLRAKGGKNRSAGNGVKEEEELCHSSGILWPRMLWAFSHVRDVTKHEYIIENEQLT